MHYFATCDKYMSDEQNLVEEIEHRNLKRNFKTHIVETILYCLFHIEEFKNYYYSEMFKPIVVVNPIIKGKTLSKKIGKTFVDTSKINANSDEDYVKF